MRDLSDATFLIPVRIESPHRLRNLELNTRYLRHHFNTNILIGEEGPPYCAADSSVLRTPGVVVIRLPILNPDLFWRTRATNRLVYFSSTPYAASLDADVLFLPQQYAKAYQLLKTNMADAVYPFAMPTKRIPRHLHVHLFRTCDLRPFYQFPNSNDAVATGGCLFFDVARFRHYGVENERIVGWGPEDIERDVRLRRLGARIRRAPGPLFHLEHRRGRTSRTVHEFSRVNENECARIASLEPTDLAAEVLTWPWIGRPL